MEKTTLVRLSIAVILPVLISCGVKDRGPAPSTSPLVSGELPAGVLTTKDKKFLVRPSRNDLAVGEMRIIYKVATQEIDLPSAPDYSYTVHYWMPKMPEMPVTPAKIEMVGAGQVAITYDVVMGGLWEITLSVQKNGAVVDSLTSSFDVPE